MMLLRLSLSGSVMIAAVLLFRLLAFRRMPKRIFPFLWAAAAVCLLVPLFVPSPISIYGLLDQAAQSAGAEVVPGRTFSILQVVWLAGAALACLLFLSMLIAARIRTKQSALAADPRILAWLTAHPSVRNIQVRMNRTIRTPLSLGMFRPVILLPASAEALDDATLFCILQHEYTHLVRLHPLCKLLYAAAFALHWWNPFAWALLLLGGRDLEYACDEAILLCGEADRKAYANALVWAAKASTLSLSLGFTAGQTVRRVRAIARFRKLGAAAQVISVTAALLLIAVFATVPMPAKRNTVVVESVPAVRVSETEENPEQPTAIQTQEIVNPPLESSAAEQVASVSVPEETAAANVSTPRRPREAYPANVIETVVKSDGCGWSEDASAFLDLIIFQMVQHEAVTASATYTEADGTDRNFQVYLLYGPNGDAKDLQDVVSFIAHVDKERRRP